jgi:predicted O-methyltransferase YrrM
VRSLPETLASTDVSTVVAGLRQEAQALGFTMSCDDLTGGLLRALAASKPQGRLLELGTGVGVGSAYLLDGMDERASLVTVDIDASLTAVADRHLGSDERIDIATEDASDFLLSHGDARFDLIFADTWAGKLERPELALDLLAPGGVYVADDMKGMHRAPTDVPGIAPEVLRRIPEQWSNLLAHVESRGREFATATLDWSTGILLCTRRSN